MDEKIRVAVVGLRFGGGFPQIYMDHPDVEYVGICDTDEKVLEECGDELQIERRHNHIEEILSSNEYNAVHIITPPGTHADFSIKVLDSGKHCACTIPVGLRLDELEAVVAAQKRNNKNYMMMETAVYTYHCFYAKELYESGKLGRIQFMRGAHLQDMENWPDYWKGFPPLKHITHAISPLLWISDALVKKVHCFGSGYMRKELVDAYNNPYPIETAIFKLNKENLSAEVTRNMFHMARPYCETFSVYGEDMSFEWHMEDEDPYLFQRGELQVNQRGTPIRAMRVKPPSYEKLLPKSLHKYTSYTEEVDAENPQASMKKGIGHHGSHPHLVHEFVRSIMENRLPSVDATKASNWTASGICAHESAMRDGAEVYVPEF